MLTNEQRELLEQWCVDLETTTHKQGRYAMRKLVAGELQYCCLGILCETAGEEWFREEREFDEGGCPIFKLKNEDQTYNGIPSPRVGDKFGGLVFREFTELNDNRDYTFKQIAAHVRKNYLNKEEVA